MNAALLEHEPSNGRRWLSFPSTPHAATRTALVRAGWFYVRGLRAWHDNGNAKARVPGGFTLARGGTCDYSTLKPVRGANVLELLADLRARLAPPPAPSLLSVGGRP
jgi:hypothetical protein